MLAVTPGKTRVSRWGQGEMLMVDIFIIGYPEANRNDQSNPMALIVCCSWLPIQLVGLNSRSLASSLDANGKSKIHISWWCIAEGPACVQHMGVQSMYAYYMCMFMSHQLAPVENVAAILVWDIRYLLGNFQTNSMQPSWLVIQKPENNFRNQDLGFKKIIEECWSDLFFSIWLAGRQFWKPPMHTFLHIPNTELQTGNCLAMVHTKEHQTNCKIIVEVVVVAAAVVLNIVVILRVLFIIEVATALCTSFHRFLNLVMFKDIRNT